MKQGEEMKDIKVGSVWDTGVMWLPSRFLRVTSVGAGKCLAVFGNVEFDSVEMAIDKSCFEDWEDITETRCVESHAESPETASEASSAAEPDPNSDEAVLARLEREMAIEDGQPEGLDAALELAKEKGAR